MRDEAASSASRFFLNFQRCRKTKDLELARLIYFQMTEEGFDADQNFCNYLVSTFVDCRGMPDALHVFNKLFHFDECSWTSLIQGWTDCGYPQNSLNVFNKMQEACICPSTYTLVAILKACSQLEALKEGQSTHTFIVYSGHEGNSFIANATVNLYAKLGFFQEALYVLKQLEFQNPVMWNAPITGYVEHECNMNALHCLEEMEYHGLCPDHATFACCLMACSSLGDDVNGKTIHSEVIVKGVEMIKTVGTALINMYIKCGLLDDARQIFDGMPDQNVALWTALILGYTEQGSGHDALECVERMQLQGVSPDESMFVCCLKACISIDCVNKGRELHSEILEKGFERNPFVSDTLVDMYMKFRHLRDARHTFEQLQSRTVVSWNVLLTGYIDNGYNEEALMCLKHMHSVGILPDEITFACSLKAFGNLKSALQARGIHSRICKEGFDKNIVVANALSDVYSRIGSLLEAQKLFDQHPVQNLGAWNTLLTCFVDLNVVEKL